MTQPRSTPSVAFSLPVPAPTRRRSNVSASLLGHVLGIAMPLAVGAVLAWLILWMIAEGFA